MEVQTSLANKQCLPHASLSAYQSHVSHARILKNVQCAKVRSDQQPGSAGSGGKQSRLSAFSLKVIQLELHIKGAYIKEALEEQFLDSLICHHYTQMFFTSRNSFYTQLANMTSSSSLSSTKNSSHRTCFLHVDL